LPLLERRLPGTVFVRGFRTSTEFEDYEFDTTDRPRQWTLIVGMSLRWN
jgi:hypothetical protein